MNKKEIARMISLADDRYIEEMYTEKLNVKRKRPALGFAAAAAVLVLAVGAGAAVLNSGDSGQITDLQTITDETETEFTDFISATDGFAALETSAADEDASAYFKDAGFTAIIDYTLDAGGESYNFISEYAAGLMSFDTGVFDDGRAIVYCDENGKPINASVNLYCSVMAREYGVSIVISDEGKVYPGRDFEETEPVKRSGVDIYGYTLGEAGGGFKNMCACFVSEGIGYSVDFRGMSYDEAISIIDGLIESGIKASDFDLSQGSSSDEDLYKEYFRIVHTSDRLSDEFDLNKYNNYCQYDEEYARDILKKSFDTSKFPNVLANMCCDENGRQVNGDISLVDSYDTEPNAPFCSIRFSMDGEQFNYYEMKKSKELCGVQVYGAEEVHWDGTDNALYLDFVNGSIAYSLYFCNMNYKDAIGIAAGIIQSGLSADDFDPSKAEYSMNTERIGTDRLKELNNVSLFAGYIPTADSIGDMKLFGGDGYGSYVTEKQRDMFKYRLFLHYRPEKNKQGGLIELNYLSEHDENSDAIPIEMLSKEYLEEYGKNSINPDNTIYKFDIEIGGFYIQVYAVCSPDELWQCLCLIEPGLAGSELSPSEVNKKGDFAGHIPQSASIDGLVADKAVKYYPVAYGDTVIDSMTSHAGFGMDYEFKSENGFISLKYGDYGIVMEDGKSPLKSIGESQLTREMLEKHFEQPSEHEGNRKYSYMWVQFYSGSWVIINADCAPETLWKCLSEMSIYCTEPAEGTVYYNGKAFNKSDLSEETLKWLEWYNSLNFFEQLATDYVPAELR